MKVYIMTDMEGVCGIVDHDAWVIPQGRYYDIGKTLLTNEVNAAIQGFADAGIDEFIVVDGHGAGGIDHLKLDVRAKYLRMMPGIYPFMLDNTFAGMAHIGQHAKAGSERAHLAHTGWFGVLDETINGVSVGEFGEMVLCAAELGVPAFFASGDQAFKEEAEALVPGIGCVAVKEGIIAGCGNECSFEEYQIRNLSALHMHPERARQMIYSAAKTAAQRLITDPEQFYVPKITAPVEVVRWYRRSESCKEYTEKSVGNNVCEALNSKGICV